MDIANIKATDQVVEIVHPLTKEPIGLRVNIMSLMDDRLKRLKNRILDERLRLDARGKNFKAEQLEENKLDITIAAITGWNWYNPSGEPGDEGYDEKADGSFRGEKPDYGRKNAVDLFEFAPWIREQIEEKIGDTEHFFTR